MDLTTKVYYTGINYLKLPGIPGDPPLVIQIDAHGGGGGGTIPYASKGGAPGGFGGHIAAMFAIPGGSGLHIGIGDGGGSGQLNGQLSNGGVVSDWGGTTSAGGKGGNGSNIAVQGGGGGALTSVLLAFQSSLYNFSHTSWPHSSSNLVGNKSITPLMWAGGGAGAPGLVNINGGGVDGKKGDDAYTTLLFGRSFYYYYNNMISGDLINTPGLGWELDGNGYGGGGGGGMADSTNGEFSYNFYNMYYGSNGGGRTYYYNQTSAYTGSPGKSGLNGYYTSSLTWHETPEIYPGGTWTGTTRSLQTTNLPNANSSGITYRPENIGFNDTKNVVLSKSQYGFGGTVANSGGNGRVTVKYMHISGQPNEIDSFLSEYDAELDTWYTTVNSVTILGINKPVPARVTGVDAKIVVNGVVNNVGDTVQITNGAVLKLYVKSPSSYNTTKEIYLNVGDPGSEVQSRYIIVTKQISPAFANPWDFVDVSNALPNKLISSDQVEITGLGNGSAPVTVSASSTSGNPVAVDLYIANIKKETNTGVIYNKDTIQLKLISSSIPGDKITALVTIGDGSAVDWVVITTPSIDTAPEFFNFTDITDVTGGSEVTSNIVQIKGINYTAAVTASNPENIPVFVSVDGGSWKNPLTEPVTIENNQTLQLKITAPNQPKTTIKSTVTVGTQNYGSLPDDWKVTTSVAGDTVPDAFLFVDRLNQKSTTVVYSNQIIVRGITSPSSLSITIPSDFTGTQAQFSVNNGTDWFNIGQTHPASPAPQTISNNSPLMLRLRTGSYGSNSSFINVNIGGVTDQWAVTTLPEAPVTDQASTWYSALAKADGYSIGTVISIFRDATGAFGTLDGSPESRYPGFIECDGRTLNVSDYPDLFDVIGNTYGGSGSKSDDFPYVYSGNFKLPDYRNRKLYGTGRVDGNVGSSPSVPTFIGPDGASGGSSTTVGSQGGFWYIDTIDAKGPYPREQVFSDQISSEFFSLGTIKTTGYQNVTQTTLFNIVGNCTAEVGPLRETMVKTPSHYHEMVSSRVSETPNGLMGWGSIGVLPGSTVGQNVSATYPGAPNPPYQGLFSSEWNSSVSYNNYWASPVSNDIPLNNSNSSDAPGKVTTGGSIRLGALDLGDNTTGNVIGYSPGGTLLHNHYISKLPFGATVYGYGNVNGPGTKFGSTSLSETTSVSFSSSQIALISDIGTFTLSTKKAIVPTAKFKPNITIPLITKYYRAKYIIKAF